MGLETATSISELVETWPLQTDKIRQGAGHLRNIKTAVKNTFPNLNAPVTATPAMLNNLPANFSTFLTELLKHVEKKGSIKVWDLFNQAVPEGWAICDGSTVSGYGVLPDMRDRFVVGAGNSYANRETGGTISKVTTAAGGHTPVIQGHALTEAENGPHTHTPLTVQGSGDDNGFPGPYVLTQSFDPQGPSVLSATLGSSGGGVAHSHGADAVPDHTHTVSDARPPYYAVVWIVKTTDFVMP